MSPKSATKKCSFGFDLKPRCGAFHIKMNLDKLDDRESQERTMKEQFPPYTYKYLDANTVIIDQCLICHIEKGFTPEEYEAKNEAFGLSRENFEWVEQTVESDPELAKKIDDKIKEERKELIKDGFPIGMGLTKDIPDV